MAERYWASFGPFMECLLGTHIHRINSANGLLTPMTGELLFKSKEAGRRSVLRRGWFVDGCHLSYDDSYRLSDEILRASIYNRTGFLTERFSIYARRLEKEADESNEAASSAPISPTP